MEDNKVYKRVFSVSLCVMVLAIMIVSQLNMRVYAFSFDMTEQQEQIMVDNEKADMFLNIIEANATRLAQDTVSPNVATVQSSAFRTITNVNIRKSRSVCSDIIDVLQEGSVVTVLEDGDDWCEIQYEGSTAFVYKEYLERV